MMLNPKHKKKLLLIFFILICLIQLSIPAYMIINAKKTLGLNRTIKLRCGLYDPYDFMKGRFIRLTFEIENNKIKNIPSLKNINPATLKQYENEEVYCILSEKKKEKDQTYIIKDIRFKAPYKELFVKGILKSVNQSVVNLSFPFSQYYMQEEFAIKADQILRNKLAGLQPVLILAVNENGSTVQKGMEVMPGISVEKYLESFMNEKK